MAEDKRDPTTAVIKPQVALDQSLYNFLMTDDDKIALLNIINMTTFKGQDVEYVAALKVRVSEAPLHATTPPPAEGGQGK